MTGWWWISSLSQNEALPPFFRRGLEGLSKNQILHEKEEGQEVVCFK